MSIKLKKCLRTVYKPQKRLSPDELSAFRTCLNTKILDFTVDTSDINTNWTSVKDLLLTTRDEIRTRDKADNPNKEWITEETWKVIKQRKDLLKSNTDTDRTQYRRLSARIQYLCRRDYNGYLNNICEDIERHSKTMHTSDLFLKVKNISRELKPKTWAVEDGAGNLLTEIDQVTERWRSYCEGLYADSHNQQTKDCLLIDPNNLEPEILESEIRCALRKLKNNKSAGRDKVYAEELKQIGDKGIKILLDLCNQVWRTGQWPNDWKESMLIPLHKKGSTRSCSNYRTVALTSHASKIMLYVINERLKTFLQWQIPEEQAGFVRGRGTREQIVNVRQLIEKSREFCKPTLMCFIDYSKAFDCVRWDCLWKILREMGVPEHLTVLITNLYKDGETVVRVNDAISGPFKPEKGVRQGCILSPILFNIYGEFIMRRALDDWQGGISIGGTKISNLRYADDTTLIASSEEELGELFRRVQYESEQVGLTVNRAKTKVLIVDRAGTLTRTGELSDLEFVSEFLYLGSLLTDQGGCEKEIRRRSQMAKSAMSKLTRIWQNRKISNKTKKRLVQTLVFSIFLYGSESWTIRSLERKKIDALEMWCWRRMLRIPWTAKRTNASILQQLNIKTRLSNICYQRVLRYFGHIARRQPDSLDKLIMFGKVEGKRPSGRCPTRWSDQVTNLTGLQLTTALRKAEDRKEWRKLTEIVTQTLDQSGHDLQQ